MLFNWIIGAHAGDCCADYRVFSVQPIGMNCLLIRAHNRYTLRWQSA
jgi:hypothetical protein